MLRSKPQKPRLFGLTEIRSPCHSFLGSQYLEHIFESTGSSIDGMKFVGGSSSLMSQALLREMIRMAHQHGVYVSTGDWSDHLLSRGRKSFKQYVQECKNLGFDMIEFDTPSETISEDDFVHLIRMINREGLKAKPGVFLQSQGNLQALIDTVERFLGAGAHVIKVETDVDSGDDRFGMSYKVSKLIERVGIEKLFFEAPEPKLFDWFIRNYGKQVNLFVDHSHITELERLRFGGNWDRLLL